MTKENLWVKNLENSKKETENTDSKHAFKENADTKPPTHQENKNEMEKLNKQLEEKDRKLKEAEDKYLRTLAEMDNLRKRSEKEFAMIKESVNAELMLKLLSIVDEFEIALSHINRSDDKSQNFQTFGSGIKIIYAKLMEVLKKEGIEEIKSLGEKMDPHRHEVLRSVDGEEDKILEVYQKGYLLRGKVLRAAKVAVGNGNHK